MPLTLERDGRQLVVSTPAYRLSLPADAAASPWARLADGNGTLEAHGRWRTSRSGASTSRRSRDWESRRCTTRTCWSPASD